jgi:hypothetical protein
VDEAASGTLWHYAICIFIYINMYTYCCSEAKQGQFDEVMERLQPALKRLTWESLNIDSFICHLRQGLDQLEDRVARINEVTEKVLETNLRQMSCTVLVNVPADQSFSLSRFVSLQEECIRKGSVFFERKKAVKWSQCSRNC